MKKTLVYCVISIQVTCNMRCINSQCKSVQRMVTIEKDVRPNAIEMCT